VVYLLLIVLTVNQDTLDNQTPVLGVSTHALLAPLIILVSASALLPALLVQALFQIVHHALDRLSYMGVPASLSAPLKLTVQPISPPVVTVPMSDAQAVTKLHASPAPALPICSVDLATPLVQMGLESKVLVVFFAPLDVEAV
jgi:hypothetical protein